MGDGRHRGHSDGHGHGLADRPRRFDRAFALGLALNLGFVGLEAAFGLYAGSLALLADAGHNLGDVLGLALAWGASILVRRAPTERHTYGLRRSSILAALANAVVLLIGVGGIALEAVRRLVEPGPVAPGTIIWVAALGILVNGITAALFARGRGDDLNIRAAFLHMAADALVSVGVVAAGLVIWLTGLSWIDPVTSLGVAGAITLSTWALLRESVGLALDAVPAGIDLKQVESFLAGLPGVVEVHDLHIWAMSTTETALTAHLVRPGRPIEDAFVWGTSRELRERFGIDHATFQLEHGDAQHPCSLAPAEVV